MPSAAVKIDQQLLHAFIVRFGLSSSFIDRLLLRRFVLHKRPAEDIADDDNYGQSDEDQCRIHGVFLME